MKSSNAADRIPQWQQSFLQRHRLEPAFLAFAQAWFAPLVRALATHQSCANRTILVALNGSQGSGKSTLADYLRTALAQEHQLNTVSLSLDDFYLTHTQRQALANSTHPLFATRGVPGTHDMPLLRHTLEQLLAGAPHETVTIPRFNKASDDRRPRAEWDNITAPVHLVILEGWCLGAAPESADTLMQPVNALERDEDPLGQWRNYSNEVLRREFLPLYALVDQWVMLRAPSFACVYDWRREQEHKLAASLSPNQGSKLMNDEALYRFVQHYERITRNCLQQLPHSVHHLYRLNPDRSIKSYRHCQHPGARA